MYIYTGIYIGLGEEGSWYNTVSTGQCPIGTHPGHPKYLPAASTNTNTGTGTATNTNAPAGVGPNPGGRMYGNTDTDTDTGNRNTTSITCTWAMAAKPVALNETCMRRHYGDALTTVDPECFRNCGGRPYDIDSVCFIDCFTQAAAIAYSNKTTGNVLIKVWLDAFEKDDVTDGGCPKLRDGVDYVDNSNKTCGTFL